MEVSDEYQDMANPGGGVAMVNIPMDRHQHTSVESPLSHQEEDLSDPDLQDEESGEELLQQPLQGNTHSSSDNASAQAGTSTPLAHLSNLMNTHHPHFMTKLKMEQGELDALTAKSGLEALQAAINSSGFNLPFTFPPPAAFLTPPNHSQAVQPQPIASGSGTGNGNGNQATSSASSHSSESSQSSGRNGGEPRDGSNHSQQSSSTGANHQQQTSWSFEEQFKQVRQASDGFQFLQRGCGVGLPFRLFTPPDVPLPTPMTNHSHENRASLLPFLATFLQHLSDSFPFAVLSFRLGSDQEPRGCSPRGGVYRAD
ncbi:hypothetical protein WN51_03385 [Melipona quadrifasciata]|uniref:Uncharacterized protein n=1 Tax=Melipona quadrifasciata TaxID=166423 RepID=A0A0M8ZVN4_9HYME|nr:hypothetical protein WN51_03385 [Melipona quadrifasciata]